MLVNVKVNPKARINKVEEDGAGGYVVWTTAAPERGEANVAVGKMLAEFLGVRGAAVRLKRGGSGRRKVFEVEE
jgi:uncharacterized protein YggU (UPF0235/DUF167 family)